MYRELFAKKKGINTAKTNSTGKMVYDEASGEWVPKWGYKGKNKSGEDQWLVEIDDRKAAAAVAGKKGTGDIDTFDPRKLSRQERVDRVKKNERQMKKNLKGSGTGGSGTFAPRAGGGVSKGGRGGRGGGRGGRGGRR